MDDAGGPVGMVAARSRESVSVPVGLWTRSLFWLGIAVALGFALTLLSGVLLPFALGAAFAFMLDPLVARMARWGVSRTVGALAVLVGSAVLLVAAIILLVPLLETQIGQMVHRFPDYLSFGRRQIDALMSLARDRLPPDQLKQLESAASGQLETVLAGAGQVVTGVLSGGMAIANILSLVFIMPIVTFFLLRDWPGILRTLDSWVPRQHLDTVHVQVGLIEETLSGFIRGQALVCLLFGCFYAIGLSIIGLDFGATLGFLSGFLIFIPYLGGLSAAVVATGLAFAQFGDWNEPIAVLVLYAVGQGVEGNIVTPKLVGDRVHLHPVWIIFALLAFGHLFGMLGVVIAVPMAAVLGVLIRFGVQSYLGSSLYNPANRHNAADGL